MAAAKIEYRCFVGGLSWVTDDQTLANAFGTYGKILESKIIHDLETGRSRGFGFVTFASEKSMRDAIEGMNGQNLDGRNITVNQAQPRPARTTVSTGAGGGGRGFRSGGGSSGYGGGGGYGAGYGRGGNVGGYGGSRGYGDGGNRYSSGGGGASSYGTRRS